MKKISGVLLTCFVIAINLYVPAQDAGRVAPPTWRVQKYDLDVTPPAEGTRSVSVRAVLRLKNVSGKPVTTLTLRLSPAAEVTAVRINDASADFTKAEEKINTATSLQRIATRFATVPAETELSAAVDYKIPIKENTSLAGFSPGGGQMLPLSYWYPTPNSWFYTRGSDMAPFRIKVSAPGQTVVSAGTETGGAFENKLNGQPFFVAGGWETADVSGVTVYLPKSAGPEARKRGAELAGLFTEAAAYAATILGKQPAAPLKIVAGRRGAGFGSGGVVVVDEAVFRRSTIDALTVMNIAETAAKLWLGNTTAITGEGNGIIGEGLSRYIATQFIESKYGKDVADIERLRQRNAYTAVSGRDAALTAASPIDDYYYTAVANKGAMAWRILARRVGPAEFSNIIKANMEDGDLNLAELRSAFSPQKDLLDHLFDQVTEMNLLVGLPQTAGGETRVALRNTGSADVTVDIAATTTGGEKLVAPATIKATSFGEVSFKTGSKIARVEIDAEKLYPQADYSDDIAPRESTDSDPLLAVKRLFDKQDYANAEKLAKTLLQDRPRSDDLRVLLGRALLAQSKSADAEREFRAVLSEKLPSSRSIAWANLGLAETAASAGQAEAAIKYIDAAISTDGEYGASLGARNLRNKLGQITAGDAGVKAFFETFDRAASSNRKAEVDALIVPGEVARFAGGVSGSTEIWHTQVRHVDRINENTVLVEANMTVKLLNKESESGLAVFRLVKLGNAWKLAAVEMFEVRAGSV